MKSATCPTCGSGGAPNRDCQNLWHIDVREPAASPATREQIIEEGARAVYERDRAAPLPLGFGLSPLQPWDDLAEYPKEDRLRRAAQHHDAMERLIRQAVAEEIARVAEEWATNTIDLRAASAYTAVAEAARIVGRKTGGTS